MKPFIGRFGKHVGDGAVMWLRKEFNLPIFYRQLNMKSKTLGPLE